MTKMLSASGGLRPSDPLTRGSAPGRLCLRGWAPPATHYHFNHCESVCLSVCLSARTYQHEAQLSPRDRAMRRVRWNLANWHATMQILLVRQVLNDSKLWSWRLTVGRCVINMCTQPWRDTVASIVLYRCHKQTDHGRVVDITRIPWSIFHTSGI